MARRSSSTGDEAVNLDSLMDALTNVVAVLILVLILLQADVGSAVQRLLGDLPPATPEQVQQAREALARLETERESARALLSAKPPEPGMIAETQARISLLEKSLKDSEVRLLDLEKLRQLEAKHQKELDAEQKLTEARIAEIRRLEAVLDATPVPQPRKPDIVRIPNSREIPRDAEIHYAYVHGDRVHLVDPITARKMVMAEFDKLRPKLLRETVKVRGGRDRKIYDQEKTVRHFASLNLTLRGQKITVPHNRPWTRLNFRIDFDPKTGGVTLAAMDNPDSEWHRICNLLRSLRRGVLIFRVHPNGFATYLKAREIADRFKVPCGWEINGNAFHNELLDEFEVNRLEEPKPQPKPAIPVPPPPKRGLD